MRLKKFKKLSLLNPRKLKKTKQSIIYSDKDIEVKLEFYKDKSSKFYVKGKEFDEFIGTDKNTISLFTKFYKSKYKNKFKKWIEQEAKPELVAESLYIAIDEPDWYELSGGDKMWKENGWYKKLKNDNEIINELEEFANYILSEYETDYSSVDEIVNELLNEMRFRLNYREFKNWLTFNDRSFVKDYFETFNDAVFSFKKYNSIEQIYDAIEYYLNPEIWEEKVKNYVMDVLFK